MNYATAYQRQRAMAMEVLAVRDCGRPEQGRLLLVEHDPVITVSRRAAARDHLLASPGMLTSAGVEVAETDRGGDITYHGPGQLVVYPILDLNRLNLGLHAYMRLLEQVVIETCGAFGVSCGRDPAATGVWVQRPDEPAKICAMGVRVSRWVTTHGLALNVAPNMEHFRLIVPCGLAGRPVTCLAEEAARQGITCPSIEAVKRELAGRMAAAIGEAAVRADAARIAV